MVRKFLYIIKIVGGIETFEYEKYFGFAEFYILEFLQEIASYINNDKDYHLYQQLAVQ